MSLREERIQELTDLIAAQMPPRTIQFTPTPTPQANAFAWYAANADALAPVVLDQSPRARTWRAIQRIAARYPWGDYVITRAFDRFMAGSDADLSNEQMTELLGEMQHYDDRAKYACDDDEAPPAR